ncbi:MAG: hypothetical protein N2559_14415, partial [Anaerolineae bacterium]|nr:hypothetical protein [Anaerolineae bacterium]
MPPFLGQLSISDWIQVFAALGQCTSGIGAMLAALFAYFTIRQMKVESERKRKDFIIQYGPKIHVQWSKENNVAADALWDKFPRTPDQVERLQDEAAKKVFKVLSGWWEKPSEKACPTKYVVLNIQNIQSEPMSGIARNLQGRLETVSYTHL